MWVQQQLEQFINFSDLMLEPHLEQLLKSSDCISQILDYLKDQLNHSPQLKDLNQDAIDILEKAVDLKTSFRYLVDGIETNRALVQVQKQQIQKKKMFIEGLQYYKATLKSQISSSKIQLSSIKDYVYEEPSKSTDWIEDYPAEQQKVLAALQQFKKRKDLYLQKESKKQLLIKKLSIQQEKYKRNFPQQIKKLYNQVTETSKIFNIKQIDTLSICQFKNKKIQQIHSLLYPLKLKEIIDIKHINQFDTDELQITIEKGFFGLYDFARQNKIMIEEKQLKFYVACFFKEQANSLKEEVTAISISRRQDFSTEEIFNNLILQQKVKPIYLNPTTEGQRNRNAKYLQLNWIGQILGSASNLINGNQFIEKIKHRVFHLNLIRYAIQNITKKVPPYFFPLLKLNEEKNKQASNSFDSKKQILDNCRLMISKCEKTTFEEYRKDTYIPAWVLKAINNLQIIKQEQKSFSVSVSIDTNEKQLLNFFIQKNYLQQLETKDFYSYFKFELIHEKNVLNGYILIPGQYPARISAFKLISLKKPSQSILNLQTSKQLVSAEQNQEIQNKTRTFSQELRKIQEQLNQKIVSYLHESGTKNSEQRKKKEPFILYFQINRLLSIFIQKSLEIS